MRVSVQENPVKPGTYRVVLHTGRKAAYEDFLKYASESCTVGRADILAVFQTALEWMHITARQGREADFGPLGQTRLGMKGQFDSRPVRIFDKDVRMTVGWQVTREMRKAAAEYGKSIVRQRVSAVSKVPCPKDAWRVLPNAKPDPVPNRYEPNQAMLLRGLDLDYDTSREDEGVFLIDEAGIAERMTRVFSVEPSQIMFMMPEDAEGTYRVEVRRRHLPDQTSPYIGYLEPRLSPVESSEPVLVEA